jgi:hypothetical protein
MSQFTHVSSQGHDEFPEKRVEEITALLHRAIETGTFPWLPIFRVCRRCRFATKRLNPIPEASRLSGLPCLEVPTALSPGVAPMD